YGSTKTLADLAERFDTDEKDIRDKLSSLGLHAKDMPRESRLGNEPLLEPYEEGLKALHGGKLDKAEKLFNKVAEECDQPELAERARQYLAMCRSLGDGGAADPEDDFLAAVYEKNLGHFDRALEIAKRGGRSSKDERFAYLEASILAAEDELDRASEMLKKAIELNGKNRIYAFHDPDFAPLRKSSEHSGIFRASSS
ncbi:MAG: hypothetical protein PVG07_16570, partial [Acidobacteriota bacterium]